MNLKIKRSPIAGKGVFAEKDFTQNELICELTGEECSIEEMIRRVDADEEEGSDPLGVDDETYLDLDEISRTFNHSCAPNAYISGKNKLLALTSIKKGDEITFDYSTTMNDNEEKIVGSGGALWTCECVCGTSKCRGIIDQFKTLPLAQQQFYIQNRYAPDFILRAFDYLQ